MAEERIHINPTLNGGNARKPQCGCDPENAKEDKDGNKQVFLRHENREMFRPFGVDAGLYITVCGQCNAIEVFGLMVPDHPRQPRPGKIQLA